MVEFDEVIYGEDLVKFIKEVFDYKLKIYGYNELIKDIWICVKDEFGVDGKMFNCLLVLYYKDNCDVFEVEIEEVVEFYDIVFFKWYLFGWWDWFFRKRIFN